MSDLEERVSRLEQQVEDLEAFKEHTESRHSADDVRETAAFEVRARDALKRFAALYGQETVFENTVAAVVAAMRWAQTQ